MHLTILKMKHYKLFSHAMTKCAPYWLNKKLKDNESWICIYKTFGRIAVCFEGIGRIHIGTHLTYLMILKYQAYLL